MSRQTKLGQDFLRPDVKLVTPPYISPMDFCRGQLRAPSYDFDNFWAEMEFMIRSN